MPEHLQSVTCPPGPPLAVLLHAMEQEMCLAKQRCIGLPVAPCVRVLLDFMAFWLPIIERCLWLLLFAGQPVMGLQPGAGPALVAAGYCNTCFCVQKDHTVPSCTHLATQHSTAHPAQYSTELMYRVTCMIQAFDNTTVV